MTQLAVTAPNADLLNASLPIKLQECSNLDFSNGLNKNVALFQLLENRYDCTGWCINTKNLFYRFSDVNRGKPQFSCYLRISERLNYYVKYAAIIAFVIAGLVFLS